MSSRITSRSYTANTEVWSVIIARRAAITAPTWKEYLYVFEAVMESSAVEAKAYELDSPCFDAITGNGHRS